MSRRHRFPGIRHDPSVRIGSGAVRRAVVVCVAALVLALAACTTGRTSRLLPPPHRIHDSRPNIVFILTDDLSTNLVQYMPHVRALEQAGTSLRNYFVVDSLCCPSRAAIFTGLYPHDDGVYTNGDERRPSPYGGYNAYNRYGNQPKSFAVA